MAAVGSECINHFATLAPGLHVQLAAAEDGLRVRIAEARKAAKAAADSVEVVGLRAEFEAVYAEAHKVYEGYRASGIRAPRSLWEVVASNKWCILRRAPEYQRACDLKKWYRRNTETLKAALWGICNG
jgi:hypothetical protein